MKKIIAANWKMNPQSQDKAEALMDKTIKELSDLKDADVIFNVPFLFLKDLLKYKKNHIHIGAQNVFWEDEGAYTGEISPLMLKNMGVEYVIIGHSERRRYLKETDEMINKKILKALKNKLKVILCVGEEAKNDSFDVLEEELQADLNGIVKSSFKNIIVAYEPIWAIGTGAADNADDVEQKILFIRRLIARLSNTKTAFDVPMLYGGSVDEFNSSSFLRKENINGFLIGSISLKPKYFLSIIKQTSYAPAKGN